MSAGQAQVRDARLEIVVKAGDRARRDRGAVGEDSARQIAGDRSRRHLSGGGDAGLELRPQIGRDFDAEVVQAGGLAALARRAGKALLDRPNDPRRAVGDDEQGTAQARARRSWKKARTVSTSSFEPAITASRTLHPSAPMPPDCEHSLPFLSRTEAFGNAVNIEIGDRVLREIALGKGLVSAHSRSVISLTAARDKSLRPRTSVKPSSMSRVDGAWVRPEGAAGTPETNGSRTPSAVLTSPVR